MYSPSNQLHISLPLQLAVNMKEKIKAVLHRRKGSTPAQSPRASYEQSEGVIPRAEQLPSSPSQRHRPKSSASQSASLRTEYAQQPKTTHTNGIATHSAALPLESVHNTQSDHSKFVNSASDGNTPVPPAPAPSKQSIVAGTNIGHSAPSHSDLSKPLPAIPSMFNAAEVLSQIREITYLQIPRATTTAMLETNWSAGPSPLMAAL